MAREGHERGGGRIIRPTCLPQQKIRANPHELLLHADFARIRLLKILIFRLNSMAFSDVDEDNEGSKSKLLWLTPLRCPAASGVFQEYYIGLIISFI